MNAAYHLYNTAVFTTNNYAYFSTGSGFNSATYTSYTSKEVIRYNPSNDTWTKMNDFPGSARQYTIGFSINGIAFMGLGWNGTHQSDIWQYNESADSWTQTESFPSPGRSWVSAFTIGGKAYMGNGISLNTTHSQFYVWEPLLSLPSHDPEKLIVTVVSGEISIHTPELSPYSVEIYNTRGQLLTTAKLSGNVSVYTLRRDFTAGTYIVRTKNISNGNLQVTKILIQ